MEGSWQDGVPIDLFVSTTKLHITSSAFNLKFTVSSSNLVFSVDRPPRSDLPFKRLISDSSGSPSFSFLIISMMQKAASWEGFSAEGNNNHNHPLLFRVERTTKSFTRVEFQVFLNQNSDFKMRGSPLYRSCTIYKGSIVAQTSLMYKLGFQKALVPRNRFRLTIFPGYADHAFIVALTVIFFYGRKLWI